MGYRKAAKMGRTQYVSGHYRTSKNGNVYWVEGHTRNDHGDDLDGCMLLLTIVLFLLVWLVMAWFGMFWLMPLLIFYGLFTRLVMKPIDKNKKKRKQD